MDEGMILVPEEIQYSTLAVSDELSPEGGFWVMRLYRMRRPQRGVVDCSTAVRRSLLHWVLTTSAVLYNRDGR